MPGGSGSLCGSRCFGSPLPLPWEEFVQAAPDRGSGAIRASPIANQSWPLPTRAQEPRASRTDSVCGMRAPWSAERTSFVRARASSHHRSLAPGPRGTSWAEVMSMTTTASDGQGREIKPSGRHSFDQRCDRNRESIRMARSRGQIAGENRARGRAISGRSAVGLRKRTAV